jgi:cytochrome c peroxidase
MAKKGFLVFLGKGQCIRCHNGKNLTDNQFHSVGTPHLFDSENPTDDLGLFEATLSDGDQYLFKTPGLRNISVSAPYMHNGAFTNLSQVISHYNNISRSLATYTVPANLNTPYNYSLVVDRNSIRNSTRFNQIPIQELKSGLRLNRIERIELEEFLKTLSN